MILLGFYAALAGCTVLYILFLLRIHEGIRHVASTLSECSERTDRLDDTHLPSVAVIVATRNEEKHIRACLASLDAQDYPREKLSIIIVDDSSTDETVEIVRAHAAVSTHLTLLQSENERGGKKVLIARAIQSTEAEIIATTDADCRHAPQWIRSLAAQFTTETDLVSAPVFFDDRSTRFARMQALEFLGLVAIGAGFIGIGFPRLCNGANIAYRRDAFISVGGFDGTESVASGDDEFLMHKIATRGGGVRFNPASAAHVATAPTRTLREFIEQRKRWASKGARYSDARFVLFLVALFGYFLLLLLSPLTLALAPVALIYFFIVHATKWCADFAIIHAASRLFQQPFRVADFLVAELLHVPYIVFSALLGTFASYRWKERTIAREPLLR